MCSTLDDAPRFDDQDLLGAADGGQAVRDHERRAAAHQVPQALLNERFRFGVQAGSRFVENKNARVGQDGARDRHALLLPAGKPYAALANHRVVLVLERFREFIHARDTARGEDFFFTGVGPAERHIFANRSVEQKSFL